MALSVDRGIFSISLLWESTCIPKEMYAIFRWHSTKKLGNNAKSQPQARSPEGSLGDRGRSSCRHLGTGRLQTQSDRCAITITHEALMTGVIAANTQEKSKNWNKRTFCLDILEPWRLEFKVGGKHKNTWLGTGKWFWSQKLLSDASHSQHLPCSIMR